MTEIEFRRGPSADLYARLELIHEALTAVAESVAAGRAPADETERDRCRRVAELLASQGRRVVDLLGLPRRRLEARVVAEQDRILAEARDREQGEEP